MACPLSDKGPGRRAVRAPPWPEPGAELPALAEEISKGTFDIDVRPTPLTDVEQTWADAAQVTP